MMDAHKLLTELRIKAGRGDPPCADMDDVELMYEYFTTERAKDREALHEIYTKACQAMNSDDDLYLYSFASDVRDIALAKRLEE